MTAEKLKAAENIIADANAAHESSTKPLSPKTARDLLAVASALWKEVHKLTALNAGLVRDRARVENEKEALRVLARGAAPPPAPAPPAPTQEGKS